VRGYEALLFGEGDYGEGNTVFGAVACAVKELFGA
jgi:hypothetical protein